VKDQDADRTINRTVEKLRNRRLELGLSLNRTAEMAGLSHVGLLQMENGERSPLLRTIVKLASALEIPLSDLFLEK
jgi:transcriptional regulator with XRE-family HTH domain